MNSPVNECILEGNIGTELQLRHTRDSNRPVINMMLFVDSSYRSKKQAQNEDHVIKKRLVLK